MERSRSRPWSRLVALAVLGLLAAACSDGDDDADEAGTTTTIDIVDDDGPDEPVGQDPSLVCVEPAPVEMGLGTAIDGTTEADAPTDCSWVEVPPDLDALTFELRAEDADLVLGVGFGFVTTVQFDDGEFRSAEVDAGTTGEVTIESPTPGPWFLSVSPATPGEYSPYTLTARTDPPMTEPPGGGGLPGFDQCSAPATELTAGEPVDGDVPARDEAPAARAYYCIETLGDFSVDLNGLSGDVDVVVRPVGGEVVATDRSRGGTSRTLVVDDVSAGAYVIEVVAAEPGTGSGFTIEAG